MRTSEPYDLVTLGETMVLITLLTETTCETALPLASVTAGGAESNVAIAAAGYGLRTAWHSRLGSGRLAQHIRNNVSLRGVDISTVTEIPSRPTGMMVKVPSPEGSQVTYYRVGSAASTMDPSDGQQIPPARVVHLSGITPALSSTCNALVESIMVHRALGKTRLSFDVNYRAALWNNIEEASSVLLKLARHADVVFVGRDEAETLWGTSRSEDIRSLVSKPTHLIVKDGPVEAVEFKGGEVTRMPAHTVQVLEPIGAGDAFAGGWLAQWLRNKDSYARLSAGHDSAAQVLQSLHDNADNPLPQERKHDE